jgi:hypothetical protein
VVRDRSPIHRRAEVTTFIAGVGQKRLWVEQVPPYAPDLNPVEWLWRRLKQVGLRNLVCLDLEEPHQPFHLATDRVRRKPETSFWSVASTVTNLARRAGPLAPRRPGVPRGHRRRTRRHGRPCRLLPNKGISCVIL